MNLNDFEKTYQKFTQIRGVRKIAQTYPALKIGEIAHRVTFKYRYKPMAQALDRFKKYDNKKPKSQIKREITLCKKFWGCYPLHYYRYNLYRKDKKLSEKDLLNYIPEFFFYYIYLPFYDPKKYAYLLSDKNICEQLFKDLSIPQPHTICKLIDHHIYTSNVIETNFQSINQELMDNKYRKKFVKPIYGEGGDGIFIFNRNDNGHYITKNGDIFTASFLDNIGAKNNYIIQAGVEQHPELSKIYPHSVNTFRIITENINGNVRILLTILRFGRNGNEVDNVEAGGAFVMINLDTGKSSSYAIPKQGEYFEKHPDTNIIFRDLKISNWNVVKKFVIDSSKKLHQFTYLGWDVALTKDGPLVIETHRGSSLDVLNIGYCGLRDIFRIDNPKYYWKNKGKRI